MIAGTEQPDQGSITIGETVELAYVDQRRDSLDASRQVWDEISDGAEEIVVGNYRIAARAYASRFNFKGSEQQKRVGQLSGGGGATGSTWPRY